MGVVEALALTGVLFLVTGVIIGVCALDTGGTTLLHRYGMFAFLFSMSVAFIMFLSAIWTAVVTL